MAEEFMLKSYDVEGTSRDSATVQDIVISNPDDLDTSRTRRIMRSLLVNNSKNKAASVKITLIHQRRANAEQAWQDVDSFNLGNLKAGQEVRLQLSLGQTYRLYQELTALYALTENGIPRGNRRFVGLDERGVVVNAPTHELVEYLLANDNPDFWQAVDELKPDMLTAVALKKQHEQRQVVVDQFRVQLEAEEWSEGDWQTFFEANTWIFGHGLAYQFLDIVSEQPHYGGVTLSGIGGQRGDFLMATAAENRFTVLVDIKKPQTELLTKTLYRNKVYGLSQELVGGIAQVQSNCRTWALEGARQEENRELLEQRGIFTYEPKGILVIGNTKQLDEMNKRATFELFRRNLHNPEVLTFDELLARASYLVIQPLA